MQNINVLVTQGQRQTERSNEQLGRLEKKIVTLKQTIDTYTTQLLEIEKKEENLQK